MSLDHTNILGDTIAKIAAEKGGIIKDEVPVVISPQTEEALKVIKTIAAERNTLVKKATREFDVVVKKHDLSGQLLNIETPRRGYEFKLPLIGKHQMENALTAICTIETLEELGHQIDKDCVESGMANLSWPGRFEVLKSSDPIVIVDGAHNPDSMDKLANTVKDTVNSSRIIVVFGSIGGHDITEMLESLKPLNPILIPVSSRHPKSVSCEVVKKASLGCGIDTIGRYDTVSQGLDYALSIASEKDLVLATGSLSVVAEVSEAINQIPPEFYYNLP
ncbi:Mur ligase family protein [Chloroflexi bacterium]|nr:Mur ligase family protein [Chloroflexota bacterium]